VRPGSNAFVSNGLATAPAGTAAIGLGLRYAGTAAGQVYLDDALIEPVPWFRLEGWRGRAGRDLLGAVPPGAGGGDRQNH
jgi:hypothetical protein